MIAGMSNGPIVKASPASGGLIVAGVLLLFQAALHALFLATFLLTLSRYPRFGQIVFKNISLLMWSIVVPAVFLAAGAVIGLMLLTRLPRAAAIAGAFCILGLLLQAVGAFRVAYAYFYTAHHPPMQTYVLMGLNTAIYLGTSIAVSRSA